MNLFLPNLFLPVIFAISTFTAPTPTQDLPGPAAPAAPGSKKQQKSLSRPKIIMPPSERTIPNVNVSGEYYPYPGVVFAKDGKWAGGDNFLNLPRAIAVQVNIFKPEGIELDLTQEFLGQTVSGILEKNGMTIQSGEISGRPPEPFFSVLILVYPKDEMFSASIIGRLFEQANMERVVLEKDSVFQVATWEQVNLVVGAKQEFKKLLTDALEGMVTNFAKRTKAGN